MDKWTRLVIFVAIIVIILLVLWLKYGGEKQKFEGLDFFHLDDPTVQKTQHTEPEPIFPDPEPIFSEPTPEIYQPVGFPVGNSTVQKIVLPDFPSEPMVENDIIPSEQPKRRTGTTRPPGKRERMCCEVMERIYGKPFSSHWGGFMVNPETGAEMELDCYNDELKLAVEYNGTQHYQWPNFTKQSREDWEKQLRRDKLKPKLCDQNGVYLITVPEPAVTPNTIEEYIRARLPEVVAGQKSVRSQIIPSQLASIPPLSRPGL